MRYSWRLATVAIVGCVSVGACSSSSPRTAPSPTSAPKTSTSAASTASASHTVWLCRPGLANDPCTSSGTTTVVLPSGATVVEQNPPASDPKIDCFYVYPTVSDQKTPVANLHVDPEERAVALTQASRFSHVCRVFAPMYRQATLVAINRATAPGATRNAVDVNVGYNDVVAAWNDYLAHDNDGRGVVFLGHSQGSGVLTRLIKEHVDPNPTVRRRLVSALLLGGNVTVKQGSDIGGDFRNIPACRSFTQTGCVVAYSSFLQPPPANSFFGRPGTGPRAGSGKAPGLQVLCVNPAAPGGTPLPVRATPVTAYFPTTKFPGLIGTVSGTPPKAPTPWVSYPGRYSVACTSVGGATWLQVTPAPGDPRPVVTQTLGPTWGLHLYDFNLTLGSLVSLVGHEAAAYSPS